LLQLLIIDVHFDDMLISYEVICVRVCN